MFPTKRKNIELILVKYKLETIKRKKEFELLFQQGKRFYRDNISAVVLPKSQSELEAEKFLVRYAVQVSRKVTKKAVVRNRIKRLLRESIRKLAKEDMNEKLFIFKYIFLNWSSAPKRPCEIHLADVFPFAHSVLEDAYSFFSKNLARGEN
ncbi:ribonuclease P protein component [Bacteroidetes/Chlorobi group bacterium MS-B_bin-24]|nr:MAG: ribonuclease P protein component [Bacteroidetes/Chlorobi group bacterium MS-B_bin-24]